MSSATKTIIIAAALLIAGLAGFGAIADDTDAVGTYVTEYKIGDRTVVESSATATVTLKTIEELGSDAPAGKAFKAWQIDAAQYAAGSTYIFAETGTKTITAVWSDITYTATFKVGDDTTLVTGTLAEAKDLSTLAPADPSQEGMIFAGWLAAGADTPVAKADLGTLSADVTYIAVFTTDWKITFVDADKTYTSSASNPEVPDLGERTGFTFLGWFIGTEQIADPATYEYEADTTFTAKWEPVILTVTFAAGETVLATQPVQYGQPVNEPVVSFPEGFRGWDWDFETPITEDVTIKALSADPIYKVTFVIGGNATVTDSQTMQIPEASKEGNAFVGWAVDGTVVDLATYEITADTVFTATFEPFTFTVTFMDEDMIVTTQTVKYGEKAIIPATGFIGWQTKAVEVVPAPEDAPEGTAPTERVTYTAYNFATPVTADLVLYGVTEDTELSVGAQVGMVIGALVIGLGVWAFATGKIPTKKSREGKA